MIRCSLQMLERHLALGFGDKLCVSYRKTLLKAHQQGDRIWMRLYQRKNRRLQRGESPALLKCEFRQSRNICAQFGDFF